MGSSTVPKYVRIPKLIIARNVIVKQRLLRSAVLSLVLGVAGKYCGVND